MRRIISLCSVLICALSLVFSQSMVSNAQSFNSKNSFTLNEIELYRSTRETPEATLLVQGYTSDEINQLKNTSYEDLMYARAQLPEETLYRMGYSTREISILKNYDGEYIEENSEVYALTGTLTAEISCSAASASEYKITYYWSWDHSPLMNATDAMGIRWVAIAQDGIPVDTSAFSSKVTITYTYLPGSSLDVTYVASDSNFASETDFNALTCTFPMMLGASSDPYYALSGKLETTIKKDSGVIRNIYYLKICGVYGHSILNFGSPSVSFTPGDTSIGISFTGTISVDNIGIKKYKIYTNRTKVPIDA